MSQAEEVPRYVSRPTAKSLWQQYRIYRDHLELDTIPFGTVRVPFGDIRSVRVRPAGVFFDLFRGDYGWGEILRTAKLDLADLAEHVSIEKNGFWRQFRITPHDPAEFQRELQAAVEAFSGHRLCETPAEGSDRESGRE